MKILVNVSPEYFDNECINILKELGDVTQKQFSLTELKQHIADYHVLLIRVNTTVNKQLLDAAKNLKVIATATAGTDHIDIEYAKQKRIGIFSLQQANTIATTEHVFALLLSLVRNIPAAHESVQQGHWVRERFIGTSLEGKKLGIVGFGKIGKEIAKRAAAFDMEILAYDPYLKPEDVVKHHARQTQLALLLQEADVVTLHVLLTDETKGLMNKEKFAFMKPSAFLLNCSRGEVVVEKHLVYALQHKQIAGAALDVFCEEPLPIDNILVHYAKNNDNLILTPHIAGSTKEAIHDAGMEIAGRVKEFFEKR